MKCCEAENKPDEHKKLASASGEGPFPKPLSNPKTNPSSPGSDTGCNHKKKRPLPRAIPYHLWTGTACPPLTAAALAVEHLEVLPVRLLRVVHQRVLRLRRRQQGLLRLGLVPAGVPFLPGVRDLAGIRV